MIFKLRVDTTTAEHIYCSLFANSANCGRITFRQGEYINFTQILLDGARQTEGIFVTVVGREEGDIRHSHTIREIASHKKR